MAGGRTGGSGGAAADVPVVVGTIESISGTTVTATALTSRKTTG